MGLRIRTNVASIKAQRALSNTSFEQKKSMEKMASGYRINRSADDAAGLAISETLKARVRSLDQAKRNASDGISLIQVAEGSYNEIGNVLTRLRELAVQAASDTISNRERSYANREYVELVQEIDRIAKTTEFNDIPLLQGADAAGLDPLTIHVDINDGSVENRDTITLSIDDLKINAEEVLGLGIESEIGPKEEGSNFLRAQAAEKLSTIDGALQLVANNRATLGSKQSRLNSTIANLSVRSENLKATNSRIRDVDFAEEAANMTQQKILASAGISVLSQANATPELALQLLR
jgi:flagellin